MRCSATTAKGLACEVDDIQPGDKYCWHCGMPVAKEMSIPPQAIPPIKEPPFKGCRECQSPASSTSVTDTGHCRKCGTLAKPPLRANFFSQLAKGIAVRSNIGIEHDRNDDYGLVARRTIGGKEVQWLIVCDGLSLSQNPHIASKVACEAASTLIELMVLDGNSPPSHVLKMAITAAQNAVLAVPKDPQRLVDDNGRPLKQAMTTIVIALVVDDKAHLAWAGDSRLYAILRKETRCWAKRLTTDDNHLEKNRAQGMSYAEALALPGASSMTQCLGPLEGNQALVPHFLEVPLTHVAAIVGLTDGAYSYVDPGPTPETGKDQPAVELARAFANCGGDAFVFTDSLINIANGGGGHDNITAAALFCN
jgi:serine/threonine protein phosphatase PrpC